MPIFRYGVLAAFFVSLFSLVILTLKTFSFGRKSLRSRPQGSIRKGIVYAFGRGMMPWEKESAAKHIPTYLAGMVYHTGVFAALFYLFSLIILFPLPLMCVQVFRILIFCGILCGLGLFIKRIYKSPMRKISCPDDYAANLLVDIFLIFSLLDTFTNNLRPYLFIVSLVMLLYIPLGKIRHCFFFFYSRLLFGKFFGRRGVLVLEQKGTRTLKNG